jgi:hypothetical protein
MKALWIALDGQEFELEGDTAEDIYRQIAELRETLNMPTPALMVAAATDPELLASDQTVNIDELDPEIKDVLLDALNGKKPSKLN